MRASSLLVVSMDMVGNAGGANLPEEETCAARLFFNQINFRIFLAVLGLVLTIILIEV